MPHYKPQHKLYHEVIITSMRPMVVPCMCLFSFIYQNCVRCARYIDKLSLVLKVSENEGIN